METDAGSMSRTDISHVGKRRSISVQAQSPGTSKQADCRKSDAAVTTTNAHPCCLRSMAATAESTPPEMATAIGPRLALLR